MDLGVYIHFPWCRRRCPYCDFAIAVARARPIPHEAYADRILAELEARAALVGPGRRLRSIYLGGGTPALWASAAVGRVLAGVAGRLAPGGDLGELEITVEANPNDCDAAALGALRAAGVDRLSIGVQAFDDATLRALGRDHSAADSLGALAAARAAGFERLSIDLICAVPGRGGDRWRAALERAIDLSPGHLSVYCLTIEPRSTLGARARRGELPAVADEEAAAELALADALLAAAGYEHYEVSNFARPGGRAIHNSLYWSGAEYLGLGAAAHSLLRAPDGGGLRWRNHPSVVRILRGDRAAPGGPLEDDPLVAGVERQGPAAVAADLLWLGLRTAAGVARAGLDGPRQAPVVARLAAAGLLVVEPDRVRPTARGLLFADEVAAALLAAGAPAR